MLKYLGFTLILLFAKYMQIDAVVFAWEPQERNLTRHQQILNQTKALGSKIQIIFYGDSITRRWEDDIYGKDVWDQYYANLSAVNYGCGGDKTQNVIWGLRNGEVDKLSPKVVVLMIGTNNIEGDTDEDIALGIRIIIADLQHLLPKVKILLLGVLPRDGLNPRVKSINAIISKYDNGSTVRFFDMWQQFIGNDTNTVKVDLYISDKLHLSKSGYQVWAKTMDPLLHQILDEK